MMPALELSVLVVSYNTRELTLACLRSLAEQTSGLVYETIVVDNASSDGSAEAIARECPGATLIRLAENIGFARANNLAAGLAKGEFLLLLNPDTVVLDGAVQRLVAFAKANSTAGIWGGRTVFADGSLNPTSCWKAMTLWSAFSRGIGLGALFRGSAWFDPEAMGSWGRDTPRRVDIVTGCFLLITSELWKRLDGFDKEFFMYGEDADLCMRAARLGAEPMVSPQATIVHIGGASERVRADKLVRLFKAHAQLMHRHWGAVDAWLGVRTLQMWAISRAAGWRMIASVRPRGRESAEAWAQVWKRRDEWCGAGR